MNRKEIKARAKEFAFNNKWNVWKVVLLSNLISGGASFILGFIIGVLDIDPEGLVASIFDLGISIAVIPLSYGATYYMIKLVKGKKVDLITDLFSKYSIFGLVLLASLYISMVTTLWTLLFIIPGIIYAYKVIMVPFLLADDGGEKKTVAELVETSKNMMDGYKLDYFVFELSFFGWILLGLVTFGIAYIWVVPYIEVANVMYYEELKKLKKVK